jgi:ATP-dependent Lon protease
VSKYTREAGVRTLERRIGGVCRAVAVRVAEHSSKARHEKVETTGDRKEVTNSSVSEAVSRDVSTLAHPPEMPIVIDEAALEDILGVT